MSQFLFEKCPNNPV